jgi:hypothetical protein
MRCAFQQAAILLLHSLKSIKAACFYVDDFVHQDIECIEVYDFSLENLCMLCVKRINEALLVYVIENI